MEYEEFGNVFNKRMKIRERRKRKKKKKKKVYFVLLGLSKNNIFFYSNNWVSHLLSDFPLIIVCLTNSYSIDLSKFYFFIVSEKKLISVPSANEVIEHKNYIFFCNINFFHIHNNVLI